MRNIAAILWDPPRELFPFDLPLLHRPILWYGFLFALGFFLGYVVLLQILRHDRDKEVKEKAKKIAESLTTHVVIGTIIGARLGDVLFYQPWGQLWRDPLSIFRVWEGGLASHGAALGILIALFLFDRKIKKSIPQMSWKKILDWLVVPAGLVAFFIRIGNLINQEILGVKTTVSWAFIFVHPADGSAPAPRHPVQLYEALFYLTVFLSLFMLQKKTKLRVGKLSGLFLMIVFVFRFFIEFLKEEQSVLVPDFFPLTMGQILSVPFAILGAFLFFGKPQTLQRALSIKRNKRK